jgi:serine acetyltransferase
MRRQSFRQTCRLIASDFRFCAEFERRPQNWRTYIKYFFVPGIFSVLMIRIQRFYDTNWLRPLGWLVEMTNLFLYSVWVDPRAEIGPSLLILHPHAIFIGGNVLIGERCVLFHQNTIGYSPFVNHDEPPESGHLVVGNYVWFGAGACAYGNITIGDQCRIGVNAVVEKSFPPGVVLFGVPARAVSKTDD